MIKNSGIQEAFRACSDEDSRDAVPPSSDRKAVTELICWSFTGGGIGRDQRRNTPRHRKMEAGPEPALGDRDCHHTQLSS